MDECTNENDENIVVGVEVTNDIAKNTSMLKEKNLDIAQKLIEEEDVGRIKDLTQMFNAAHIKK